MATKFKLLFDSFMEALPLGTTFVFIYIMINAAFNDWVAILDFNKYGEGLLELTIILFWLAAYIYKLSKEVYEYARRRTIKRTKKIPNASFNTRKQYYNL